MSFNEITREQARDWLVTGQEGALRTWLEQYPLEQRLSDPFLLLLEGELYRHERQYPEAAFCFEKAAERFEQQGDDTALFAICGDRLGLAWDRQDGEEMEHWIARAQPLFEHGAMLDRAEFQNNVACVRMGQGRTDEAERLWRQVQDLPRFGSRHIASIQQFAALNLGVLAMNRTELEEAQRRFRKALNLATQHPLRPSIPFGAQLYLARVALMRGALDEATSHLETLPPAPDPYRAAEALQLRGELAIALGDWAVAERAFNDAIEQFDLINAKTADLGNALAWLGAVRAHHGRSAAAHELHARAMELCAGWPQYQASCLLVHSGLQSFAREEVERAWELARQTEARYFAAWAGLLLGGERAAPAQALVDQHECHGLRFIPALAGCFDPVPEPAAPDLELQLFGPFYARVRGQAIDRWQRRKVPVLLAALALKPQGYGREELAELLFPDFSGPEAEHQLDNLTSTLRKLLESDLGRKSTSRYLEVKRRCYRLVPGTWTSDLERTEQGIARAEALRKAGDRPAWREQLQLATREIAGPLLPESTFLPWFEAERQYWRQRSTQTLLVLAEDLKAAKHDEEAQELWERILVLDPLCEEAHEQLIELYGRFGRRNLIAAQRERYRQALRSAGLDTTQG